VTTPVTPDQLITNEQARKACGDVSRHTLIAWREGKGFPAPWGSWPSAGGSLELWDRREVEAWWKVYKRERRRK
jgi:hypothetical protein